MFYPPRDQVNILVANSELASIELIVQALPQRYRAFAARTVAEARHKFDEMFIDLVLTDLVFEDGSAREFIEHVSSSAPSIPIIVYSRVLPLLEQDARLRRHADVCLPQPCPTAALISAVENQVANAIRRRLPARGTRGTLVA